MNRFAESFLSTWKDRSRRKPLIVRGARQTGKTWLVEHFGRSHFGAMIRLNFERNPKLKEIFLPDRDPVRICAELAVATGTKCVARHTLLFMDEIQACREAIESLRYFYEEMPDLHVIAAGSLLEFAFSDTSFPVGRVQMLELHPMRFAEYLTAMGNDQAARIVSEPPRPLAETVHHKLLDELRNYFYIGGMPEAVKTFRETRQLSDVFEVQDEIVQTYRADFAKYRPVVDHYCIDSVLSGAARSVGRQTKYSRLESGYSFGTVKKAFEHLTRARILYRVSSVNPPRNPPAASVNPKVFKTCLVDIGLMQRLAEVSYAGPGSPTDLLDIYRGSLAEQFVGQEIKAATKGELYYWSRQARGSTAEVDYIFSKQGRTIPVEVKSGAPGHLRSLSVLMKSHPSVQNAFVLSTRPYEEVPRYRLTYAPLYYAFAIADGLVSVP